MKKIALLIFASSLMLIGCKQNPSNAQPGEATVYLTREISPVALVNIYKALGVPATGRVAIKMSTGEGSNPNYLKPELVKDLFFEVDGTLVECNTAYSSDLLLDLLLPGLIGSGARTSFMKSRRIRWDTPSI